jgi:hypothetical protein
MSLLTGCSVQQVRTLLIPNNSNTATVINHYAVLGYILSSMPHRVVVTCVTTRSYEQSLRSASHSALAMRQLGIHNIVALAYYVPQHA